MSIANETVCRNDLKELRLDCAVIELPSATVHKYGYKVTYNDCTQCTEYFLDNKIYQIRL
jgi:hypothetical protein